MNWMNKMERKFGKYAIKNLMTIVIGMYIIGTIVFLVNPEIYYRFLCLDPQLVLKGQVWRLITFLMMPPSVNNIFFMILSCYIYWSIGNSVQRAWGPFRFNLYYFGGVICTIVAAFILMAIYQNSPLAYMQVVYGIDTTYINFSLILAFAFTYPDAQFLLFFIIPIKAKWFGVMELAVYAYMFVVGGLATRVMIGVSLLNFLVFFLMTRNMKRFSPKEIKRRQDFKQKVKMTPGATKHRCAVCGKTEKDGDNLEFRFCSKCEGNREYCQDHLYTHIHVTKESLKNERGQNQTYGN